MTTINNIEQKQQTAKKVFIGLFVLAQVLMPMLHLSVLLNFDTSCYSGGISFIERLSSEGSCGANVRFPIGFPFVINAQSYTIVGNVITILINAVLAVIAFAILYIFLQHRNKRAQSTANNTN